jgi:hypothetical protein
MVGQPPFGTAVGHLPPLALMVCAKHACHVADQPTAVDNGDCQSLPPPNAAVGRYRHLRWRQVPNRCGKSGSRIFCVNVESYHLFL